MDHLALVPAYLIIGAGAFGASTALALKKAMPNLPITLIDSVDFPDPSIGSFDYDKLVRADYDDPLYLAMALRAQYQWRTNPLYSQFYHESGMVNIEETGQGRRMINNYALWRVPTGATVVSPEQLRAHYPIFQDTDYTDVKEIFVNPESGWVEAKPALTAVIKAAINLGVNYIQGTVMKIFFDSAGDCAGARLVDGTIIDAVKVIMSTGAWTAKLLADSTQGDPTLQVHDRMDAAAVVVGTIQLTPSQLETYKDMPVLVHKKEGVSGEAYPPSYGGRMKICRNLGFTHSQYHPEGITLSTPLEETLQSPRLVPQVLRDEVQVVMKGIWGRQAEEMDIDEYRICWDAFTPNQDFIICPHPNCGRLFFATGGSFHSWKFFPVLGDLVVEMLLGVLKPELAMRFAWDRPHYRGAQGMVTPPDRELVQVLGEPAM